MLKLGITIVGGILLAGGNMFGVLFILFSFLFKEHKD
jgi:hypothetical protein